MIPKHIHLRDETLPESPGVYLMKDQAGVIVYVGKATSLKRRVQQHFLRPHNRLIEDLLKKVDEIDYVVTGSALEALILEANLIKRYLPYYNTLSKDGKSFLHLVFTRERFPKPLLLREQELDPRRRVYLAVFGPYTSARSLRASLDWLRRIFPWSTCEPNQKKPCFFTHIGLCPGVCTGTADERSYRRTIRDLMAFFEGKKDVLVKRLRRDMAQAARKQEFERAARIRNQLFALEHIQDVALLKREEHETDAVQASNEPSCFLGRIEGYDISHAQGSSTVASMVVVEKGRPAKQEYRTFRIKTVHGSNDIASMREVLTRRFQHHWTRPDVLLVDGGLGQVHAAESVLRDLHLEIPVVGMVKGPERKRADIVCSRGQEEICRVAEEHRRLLTLVRDEAHRFAVRYHRVVRAKAFLGRVSKKKRPSAKKIP